MRNTFSLLLLFLMCIPATLFSQKTSTTQHLRIMSYNVRNGIGMDNQTDYRRVANVITKQKPDVVALQELDSVTTRSEQTDVLKSIADATRMHPTYAAAIPHQGGKYGIGILSKEKPLAFRIVELPGREEKRTLLIAEFEQYIFCSTHFSLTEEDQLASVKILADELNDIRKPLFLAGDLNTLPDSPVMGSLKEKFTLLSGVDAGTYPADKPEDCIDYILLWNDGRSECVLRRSHVVEEPLASDHRPIVADVSFK